MRTWLLRVKFWIPKYLHMNLQVVELTAPSASLQMTPSWVVQMIQQKNRWHPEEPLGLERWVYTNLRKFKKAKCKVMQPGWGNSKCQYRLGGWVDWEPQSRDGLGGVGWWKKKKNQASASNTSLQPRKQIISWAAWKRSVASRLRDAILSLCSALARLHIQPCIQLWGHEHKKDTEHLVGLEEGWSTPAMKAGWGS